MIPQYQGSDSLSEAREWVMENRWEGVRCPCCTRFSKVYPRRIHIGMARALILMWKAGGQEWQETRAIDNSGNISKLAWWGLVEADERRGSWRVTDDGVDFIRGKIEVAHIALVYNGQLIDMDDSAYTDIRSAFDSPFDYDELMRGGSEEAG